MEGQPVNHKIQNDSPTARDGASQKELLAFFLRLYMLQLGVEREAPGSFRPVETRSEGPENTFELRVKSRGKWFTRRITLALIGEKSGSRSRCFKVIYDDVLVVKIPNSSVKNFQTYQKNIFREREVAAVLSPQVKCIVPSLAPVVKKIPAFSHDDYSTGAEVESRCVDWLNNSQKYQNYLKIGDSFIYFMDMSHFSFLSQEVKKIHGVSNQLHKEIVDQTQLICEYGRFKGRYEWCRTSTIVRFNKIYKAFEVRVARLLATHELAQTVPLYTQKEWFLRHIAGKTVRPCPGTYSLAFISDLNHLLHKLLGTHQKEIEEYRRTVRQHLWRVNFNRNRQRIQDLISQMIDLLVRIQDKGIAMRDLKPDNIFVSEVACGSSNMETDAYASRFANQPKLGLIDLETAMQIRPQEGSPLVQPNLGGTPSYATLTHFMNNKRLSLLFTDLSWIYCVQDWHATVGMIFNIATGGILFQRTRPLLGRIFKFMRAARRKGRSQKEVSREGNLFFWQQLTKEFNAKTKTGSPILGSLRIKLSDAAADLFRAVAKREAQAAQARFGKRLESQSIIRSRKYQVELAHCSSEKMRKILQRWVSMVGGEGAFEMQKAKVIPLFRELVHLKYDADKWQSDYKQLNMHRPVWVADELMHFMFRVVLSAMIPQNMHGQGAVKQDRNTGTR